MDSSTVYAEVKLPYRDPASCKDRPEIRQHQSLGRMVVPDQPGIGSAYSAALEVQHTPVTMLNGRKLLDQGEVPTLDEQGFAFCAAPSMMQNWDDPKEVLQIYFAEVEALVRKCVPGADHKDAKVLVFDHALRTGGSALKDAMKNKAESGYGPYGALVHSDNNFRSVHARAKDWLLGTTEVVERYGCYPSGWGDVRPSREWRERLFRSETLDHMSPEGHGGEHMIVNVWRPLAPVKNWGLAMLDGRTLAPGEHPTVLQHMAATGFGASLQGVGGQVVDLDGQKMDLRMNELLTPCHHPAHRWIYYPNMQPDEALVFKINDSRRHVKVRGNLHTAFPDPCGEPGAHRTSIEVRTLVILPPKPTSKL